MRSRFTGLYCYCDCGCGKKKYYQMWMIRKNNNFFYSHKHYAKWLKNKKRNKHKTTCSLPECKKMFEKPVSQCVGNTFCSSKCRQKWYKKYFSGKNHPNYHGEISIKCQFCEREFSIKKSELKVRKKVKYCSNTCYGIDKLIENRISQNCIHKNEKSRSLMKKLGFKEVEEFKNFMRELITSGHSGLKQLTKEGGKL